MTPPSATGQDRDEGLALHLERLRGWLAEEAKSGLFIIEPSLAGNKEACADFLEVLDFHLGSMACDFVAMEKGFRTGILTLADLERGRLDVIRASEDIRCVVADLRASGHKGHPPRPLSVKELTAYLAGAAHEAGYPLYGNAANLEGPSACSLAFEALQAGRELLQQHAKEIFAEEYYRPLLNSVPRSERAVGDILRERGSERNVFNDKAGRPVARMFKFGRWAWGIFGNRQRDAFAE